MLLAGPSSAVSVPLPLSVTEVDGRVEVVEFLNVDVGAVEMSTDDVELS